MPADSLVRRMARALGVLVRWADKTAEALLVALFAGIVIVGGLQVFSRKALGSSLSWSEEFQRYGLIWMVFLALVAGYRRGAHIGMEILFQRLPVAVRRALTIGFDLMWLGLGGAMLLFTAFARSPANLTFLQSVSRQRSAGMDLPMHWIYACIVVGGAYLMIAALYHLLCRFAGMNPLAIESDGAAAAPAPAIPPVEGKGDPC